MRAKCSIRLPLFLLIFVIIGELKLLLNCDKFNCVVCRRTAICFQLTEPEGFHEQQI